VDRSVDDAFHAILCPPSDGDDLTRRDADALPRASEPIPSKISHKSGHLWLANGVNLALDG
jgi:hypothetical protein